MCEAVTSAGVAFVRWILVGRNRDAGADIVLHVACLARPAARLVATYAVHAVACGALRACHARVAVSKLAGLCTVAGAGVALVVRVEVDADGAAHTVRAGALERACASLTSAGADRVAAIPVNAEAARAIRGLRANRADNTLAIAEAVALAGVAFIAGVGVGRDVRAASHAACICTRHACPETSRVAADAVNAVTAHALIARRARGPVVLLALPDTVARARVAFIHRVVVGRNGRTSAEVTRDIARFAGIRADRVATDAVDAIAARALRAVQAGVAVCLFDLAGRRVAEVPVRALAVGDACRLASASDAGITRLARLIEFLYAATLAVAGISGVFGACVRARSRCALCAECVLRAARAAGAHTSVSAGIRRLDLALVIGIGAASDSAAIAVQARAFFRRRAGLAFAAAA